MFFVVSWLKGTGRKSQRLKGPLQYLIRAAYTKAVHCSYSYCFMPTSALTMLTSISAPQNRITKFSNLLNLGSKGHCY